MYPPREFISSTDKVVGVQSHKQCRSLECSYTKVVHETHNSIHLVIIKLYCKDALNLSTRLCEPFQHPTCSFTLCDCVALHHPFCEAISDCPYTTNVLISLCFKS